jgi:hypothetical protein
VLMRQGLLEHLRGDGIVYHGYSGHLLLPPLPHEPTCRTSAPPWREPARAHPSGEKRRRGGS